MDCEESQSRIEQNVSREDVQIQYEQCSNCNRRFFKGRLALHQKLCTNMSPMLISHSPKTRSTPPIEPSEKALFSPLERRCPNCQTKLPGFIYKRHVQKCTQSHQSEQKEINKQINEIDLEDQQKVKFPIIKKAPRIIPSRNKDFVKVQPRQELSCFRLAQEIQKIECPSCRRHFAKDAAQRHLPICQKLRKQEKFDSIFKNRNSPRTIARSGKIKKRGISLDKVPRT